jgi:hypothetical protein
LEGPELLWKGIGEDLEVLMQLRVRCLEGSRYVEAKTVVLVDVAEN